MPKLSPPPTSSANSDIELADLEPGTPDDLESGKDRGSESSNEIQIETDDLNPKKVNQLKKIKRMIRLNQAYSLFFYGKSRFWLKVYWVSSIMAILLAGVSMIVNVVLDPCSEEDVVQRYNVLFSAMIFVGLGVITTLNAPVRQRKYEEGGDKYKQLAKAIYREVLFSNSNLRDLDLEHIIEKYSFKMDDYSEMYNEPSVETIDKIMHSKKYDLVIKLKHN